MNFFQKKEKLANVLFSDFWQKCAYIMIIFHVHGVLIFLYDDYLAYILRTNHILVVSSSCDFLI